MRLSVYSLSENARKSQSTGMQITNEMLHEGRAAVEPFLKSAEVDLSDKHLGNVEIWALGNLLAENKYAHVTSVCLKQNEFEDAGLSKLLASLERKDNLYSLDLSDNDLNVKACLDLSINLAHTPLKKLDLADSLTKMDEIVGIRYLADMLEVSQLTHLNLAGCNIALDLKNFCKGVRRCATLKSLNLEYALPEDGLKMFVDEMCKDDNECMLEELVLDYCHVPDAKVLGPLFAHPHFRNLRKLSLEYAFMNTSDSVSRGGKLWNVIINHMAVNRNITELRLGKNKIGCMQCQDIGKLFSMPTALRKVDLSENNISGHGAKLLYRELAENKIMTELNLYGNPCLEKEAYKETTDDIKNILERNEREGSKNLPFNAGHEHVRGTQAVRSKLKRVSAHENMGRGVLDKSLYSMASVKKKKGKRRFASKAKNLKANRPPRKIPTPLNASDNLSGDDSTFVNMDIKEEKPKRKRNFAKKLQKKAIVKPKENISLGSFNNNLNDDYSSVVLGESAEKLIAPEPKVKRNFALKKKMLNLGAKKNIQLGAFNNNIEDEEDTCVFGSTDNESFNIDSETVISSDDANSVVFESVESSSLVLKRMEAEDPRKMMGSSQLFNSIKDETDSLDDRITEPPKGTWSLTEIRKSELGFIKHMQQVIAKSGNSSTPAGLLSLKKQDLEELSKMLCEWENLLDRDEYIKAHGRPLQLTKGANSKRPFAGKMGVIGKLADQKPGEVVNYTLAKSAIGQTLISRALVRNIYLLSLFQKLQRELGSGVPTKIGGMLPSVLLDGLLDNRAKHPTVENVESFASSFLMIKVVIWSILKALCISKPEVDPNGRHLLEEFGKAMYDKSENRLNNQVYEEERPEDIDRKEKEMGKTILKGAALELVDALILLKPMLAVADAIFGSGVVYSPQVKLAVYEHYQSIKERKAKKKISKKMAKVNDNKKFSVIKKLLEEKKGQAPATGNERQSIGSKASTVKRNALENLLKGVDNLKKKKDKSMQGKKDSLRKKRDSKKIPITPEMQRYRHNCKERLRTVLHDIRAECRSLDVILGVEGFLPMLFCLVDFKDLDSHYKAREEKLRSKMEGWFSSLAEEFNSDFIANVQSEVVRDIETFLEPKKAAPKPAVAQPKDAGSLYKSVLRKAKVKTPKAPVVEVPKLTVVEQQSHFNPILNKVFAPDEMSPGMIDQVKTVFAARMKDSESGNRENMAHHLRKLCGEGPNETLFVTLAEVAEKFRVDNL